MKSTRQAFAIILICAVLLTGTAFAENNHYAVRLTVNTSSQELSYDADIYSDNGILSVVTSLLPEICIQGTDDISPVGVDQILKAVSAFMADDEAGNILSGCLTEWMDYLQPATETGSYAGDAFSKASRMERAVFSVGDLVILSQIISTKLSEAGFPPIFDESDLSSLIPDRNYQFEVKLFDQRKYISVNVMNRQDVIMTLSADLSRPEQAVIIAGYGLANKNYFHRIELERQNVRHFTITDSIYADDHRLGFQALSDSNLIVTFRVSANAEILQRTITQLDFTAVMTPANEKMIPVEMSGTIYPQKTGRIMDMNAGFTGYSDLAMHLTVDADQEPTEIGQRTIISFQDTESKTFQDALDNMKQSLYVPMIQIITSIPDGYLQLLMNGIGDGQ